MCLTLTTSESDTLPLHASLTMTDSARRFYDALHWACKNLKAAVESGNMLRPLCKIYAARLTEEKNLKMDEESLRRWYYKFDREGPKGLINKRLMGTPAEKKKLPPGIIDEFWATYLGMKDKASKEGAWKLMLERLAKGDRFTCGLTWQRLHMTAHPADELPEICPWSEHNPPPGWSCSNFITQQVPSDVAKALSLKGIGAARALLAKTAGVRISWDSLRIGEALMIDDHDVDFMCLVQGQLVRLRLIVLRDVRTRRHLAYVVRPRLKEEDGTTRSITRRDVHHLIAGFLWNFGLPRDYPCYLHCENAAAAIDAEFEQMLLRVTGGRLIIDRTALYKGVVKKSGFWQSGGTPTEKGIIESGFRLFDIFLSHVRGATGSNYTRKPEELQGRLNAAKKLVDRVRALPVEAQNHIAELIKADVAKAPFLSLWEAHEEIAIAMARLDARDGHDMEGFLKVVEFRTAKGAGPFYPLNRELIALRSDDDKEIIREYLEDYTDTMRQKRLDWGRQRAESSVECWLRLGAEAKFVSISRESLFDLMLDGQNAKWSGTGEVRLKIDDETLTFRGHLPEAVPHQEIRLRYNQDAPRAVWVQDKAGRVLGTLTRKERLDYHDAESIAADKAFKATVLARGLHEVRGLEMYNRGELNEIEDNAMMAALVSAFEGEQGRPTPVAQIQSETSTALFDAVAKSVTEPPPDETDAWEELQRLRRARA